MENRPNMYIYHNDTDPSTIYPRSSVRNNGHTNAVAGIGLYSADGAVRAAQHSDAVTNQRADLEGTHQAMVEAEMQGIRNLQIATVNQNVVYGFNNLDTWQANGYRTTRNQPVQNQDILQDIAERRGAFDTVQVTKASTHDESSRIAYMQARDAANAEYARQYATDSGNYSGQYAPSTQYADRGTQNAADGANGNSSGNAEGDDDNDTDQYKGDDYDGGGGDNYYDNQGGEEYYGDDDGY